MHVDVLDCIRNFGASDVMSFLGRDSLCVR
jgi:hypothetical protein